MCGKCGHMMGKAACASIALGVVSMLLAIATRLTEFAPMMLGPRSFAAESGLLFLLAIAIHTCGACQSGGHSEQR